MKPLLLFALSFVLVVSCQKDINTEHPNLFYLQNVKKALSDSLSTADFLSLDFSKAKITNRDSFINYLRIPFKGIKMSQEFVLIKTSSEGSIFNGFIINLTKDTSKKKESYVYNGVIKITSLNRSLNIISTIINGYITAYHSNSLGARSLVVPSESNILPEVVVTCFIHSADGGGTGFSDWINVMSFFEGPSTVSGIYNSMDEGGGGGGAGGGYGGGGDGDGRSKNPDELKLEEVPEENTISIDFEPNETHAPIDLSKYIKCFSNIPDAGSTCSIEILSDIPVDNDPNKLLNWQTGSPGHTFLQLKKVGGNLTLIQNIGFYPLTGWKTLLTNGPVESKFVDNGDHEFNASLKMNLTPEQFKKTLDHMMELSKYLKYDIDEYNCTDFALDVFNTTRLGNAVEIPKYNIPGGITSNGTSTPQGVYNRLKSMQQAGSEYPNITIPGVKGFVADSNGPCN